MKGFKFYIKAQFVVLIFSLLGLTQLDAQTPLWVYGNQVIDFSGSYPVANALPQPADYGPNLRYHGQSPTNCQTVQCDKNGNILFFIIDGNIYNGQGYLIASAVNELSLPSENQFQNYKSKIAVTNVPGYCNLFYIFSAFHGTLNTTADAFVLSILDITANNPNFQDTTGIKGSLRNISGLEDSPTYLGLYNSLTALSSIGNDQVLEVTLGSTKSSIELIEILEISENEKIVAFGGPADGITFLNVNLSGISINQDISYTTGGGTIEELYGGLELGIRNNGDRVYASSSSFSPGSLTSSGAFVTIGSFASNGQVIDTSHVYLSSNFGEVVRSLEFTHSGEILWFTKNSSPYIGAIDMNTLDIINVPFGADTLFAKADIEIQKHGSNYVIFAATSAGLIEISNIENPAQSEMYFNTITGLNFPNTYANYFYTIQSQNCNYSVLQDFLQSGTCCHAELEQNALGSSIITNSNDGNWNINNPIESGSNVVHVMQDLVFLTGTSTVISDLTFEFDQDANLIIQKGASVRFIRCKLTSLSCNQKMWPGINLLGSTNIYNSIDQVPAFGGDQGNLILDFCTLENAVIGVEVGTAKLNGGGIVRGTNSKFRNNARDVYFRRFHYVAANGDYAVNKSSFAGCEFVTDHQVFSLNYDGIVHVDLNDVDFIKFSNCSFMNKTSINIYNWMNRGKGIYAKRASFTVSGTNNTWSELPNDLTNTTFYKLTHGIKCIGNYLPQSAFVCKKQSFQNCMYGISAIATPNAQIYLNDLAIPDAAGYASNDVVERGVHLSSCTGFLLEQNSFAGLNDPLVNDEFPGALGVWIQNSGDNANEVRSNDFSNLKLGILVQGNNEDYIPSVNGSVDNEGGSDQTGLQILCNVFNWNNTDVFRDKNTTLRLMQGGNQLDGSVILAANKFSSDWCSDSSHDFISSIENSRYLTYVCNYDPFLEPDCFIQEYNQSNNGSHLLLDRCECDFVKGQCEDGFVINENISLNYILGLNKLIQMNQTIEDARQTLKLLVDGNNTQFIINELNNIYPQESSYYYDLLVEKFPLSDTALKAIISRAERLNPFQLTEILIANSPLERDIIEFLKTQNVLDNFFMNYVYQIDKGYSSRKLMEIHIMELCTERDLFIKKLAYNIFQSDTSENDNDSQLINVSEYISAISQQNSQFYLKENVATLFYSGDLTAAKGILNQSTNFNDLDWIFENCLDSLLSAIVIDSINLNKIQEIIEDPSNIENGLAWGILQESGMSNDEPVPSFPNTIRSSSAQSNSDEILNQSYFELAPNPSNGVSWVTYPLESENNCFLRVFDPQGRLVSNLKLQNSGIMKLDFSKYPNGIYLLEFVMFNQVAETKRLNIIH